MKCKKHPQETTKSFSNVCKIGKNRMVNMFVFALGRQKEKALAITRKCLI